MRSIQHSRSASVISCLQPRIHSHYFLPVSDAFLVLAPILIGGWNMRLFVHRTTYKSVKDLIIALLEKTRIVGRGRVINLLWLNFLS